MERCGLNKDIVITSMFTNMEIWDKTKYEEHVAEIDAEALAKGAEELFSSLNFSL